MSISRRDWWLGVAVVALVILLHAAVPRYEWRQGATPYLLVRIDRWTGRALQGRFDGTWWKTLDAIAAEAVERRQRETPPELDLTGVPRAGEGKK